MSDVAISDMADVNPPARIPKGLIGESAVSFIPMTDVSESGCWTFKQSRPLKSVTAGFTAFEEGDVLVAKITPCLENGKGAHAVGLENGIGFGSTEFHVLRARMGNEPRFVFHLSQWRRFRRAAESQMVGSAGQQRVPRAFFDGFRVSEFSAVQQARIAQILDTLDTAIHETEAIIAKLKAVKQGLLHDLLTRGIDANGELRPPKSEAPHLYKPSPLGWIPKEWGTPTFAELQSQPILGLAVRGAAPDGRNVGLVKMGNLCENNELDLTSVEGLAISRVKNIDKFLLEDGDLLFNTRNTPELVGKTCSWHGTLEPYVFDNNILRARIPRRIGSGHYFAHYLGSEIGRRSLLRLATGTTSVAAIYWKDLGSLKVPAPPTAEQAAIHEMIKSVEVKRSFVERGLQILRQMKAGLMDDLLTGRVRVTPLLQEAQHA